MQQQPPPPFGQPSGQWPSQTYDGGYGIPQQHNSAVPANFPPQQTSLPMGHENMQPQQPPSMLTYNQQQHQPQQPGPGVAQADPLSGMLATGVASGALQSAYGSFQKGQQYVQSKMNVFSGGPMYHLFAVTTDYVISIQLACCHESETRTSTGGSTMRALNGTFQPESMYNTAWYAAFTWLVQFAMLKAALYMLGIASYVPWLELLAYSGYMFFPLCITVLSGAFGGTYAYYIFWAYGSICVAVFLVRTMKRIIFHEVQQYGVDRTLHNYLLLAVAVAQFPLALWLGHV